MDPTVVIRDRKFINSLGSSRPPKNRGKARKALRVALWGGAGLLAFGIGGVLALLTTRRSTEPSIDATLQHSGPAAVTAEAVAEAEPAPAPAPAPAVEAPAGGAAPPEEADAARDALSAGKAPTQDPAGGPAHIQPPGAGR
jgi:hypothetical protein